MPNDQIDTRYAFALELIRDAGDLAHRFFKARGELTVKTKGPQDLVSEADTETEVLIRDRLAAHFPEDAFLGEETGLSAYDDAQGIWVVDPIDGTQPFISGLSSWCVSIAFVLGGQLMFGMVYAPARDELFAGGVDFPATLNGQPVDHHPGGAVNEGIMGVGYSLRVPKEDFLPTFVRLLDAGGVFYRDGSGALTLCYVASGKLLGYVEAHINSWDCLGAIAVIRAAGLKTSDFLAKDGLRTGNPLIAGNEAVYRELEKIVAW